MPRPRTSRCGPIASAARPITRSPEGESSPASSATSRFPRAISSSAHSLLPAPLGPASSTPTPPTSTSTPWTLTSELGVFFLDRVDHVLERLALREALAEGRIAEEPGDPRERFEVLPAGVLRHHQQEEVVGGLTVDRFEIDARATAREARHQPVETRELPVGDRDALADARALERFALHQHV